MHHSFLDSFWPSLHDCDMKLLNFTCPLYGVGEHNTKASFSFSKQQHNQTPGISEPRTRAAENCIPRKAVSDSLILSSRPHFLRVYRGDNPRGMFGEHEKKKLVSSFFTQFLAIVSRLRHKTS